MAFRALGSVLKFQSLRCAAFIKLFFSDNPVLLDGDLFMRTAVLLRGHLLEKIRFKTGLPFFFDI